MNPPTIHLGHKASERGSATVELAVLTPLVLLVLTLLIAGGRVVTAQSSLDAATSAAARAASLARTPTAAQNAAQSTGAATLAQHGLTCTNTALRADTTALAAGPGTRGNIAVTGHCHVALADLLAPGLPGNVPLTSDFASFLDPYRTST